jgi:hypothetical protein
MGTITTDGPVAIFARPELVPGYRQRRPVGRQPGRGPAAGQAGWEQAAGECGRLVVDWVCGRYRRVAAG